MLHIACTKPLGFLLDLKIEIKNLKIITYNYDL